MRTQLIAKEQKILESSEESERTWLKLKSNLKEIKILKEFEMPYKIEASALYEKEESIGFPKSLKNALFVHRNN